jgi:hypothetical protein
MQTNTTQMIAETIGRYSKLVNQSFETLVHPAIAETIIKKNEHGREKYNWDGAFAGNLLAINLLDAFPPKKQRRQCKERGCQKLG